LKIDFIKKDLSRIFCIAYISMFSNTNLPLICSKFYCNFCDYGTNKKSSYTDHLCSVKHQKSINGKQNIKQNPQKICSEFICKNCNKKYKDNSGLWRHKKKCKQNQDLQKQMLEVCKNGTNNTTNNNTNNNSHNKTFNLQFFLNETCKDAMNIMDFVESIKVQLCDLEKVGQIGYVEGISNIIVKNLNSLDETKRPVHCTDVKREVLYVKDENKWEKENNDKQKLRKVIKEVAYKNSKMLKEYKTKHPDCDKGDSKFSDQYNKLIIEAMGGKGDNDLEKEDKIIKNIAKEVTIEK